MLIAQLFNNKANKLLNRYTKQSLLLSVDQNISQESNISASCVRKYNKRTTLQFIYKYYNIPYKMTRYLERLVVHFYTGL